MNLVTRNMTGFLRELFFVEFYCLWHEMFDVAENNFSMERKNNAICLFLETK